MSSANLRAALSGAHQLGYVNSRQLGYVHPKVRSEWLAPQRRVDWSYQLGSVLVMCGLIGGGLFALGQLI